MANPNGPEREERILAPTRRTLTEELEAIQIQMQMDRNALTERFDILARTAIEQRPPARINEAVGYPPLPLDLTKGTLSSGGADTDLGAFYWSVYEMKNATAGGPTISRKLLYFFGSDKLEGYSEVSIPTSSRPEDIRFIRRDVSIALAAHEDQWHLEPLAPKVATWRAETVRPFFPSGYNHNTLKLNIDRAGAYSLIVRLATETRERDVSAALVSDSDFWESQEGVPTTDALQLQELFGVDQALLRGFDDSRLSDLLRHALFVEHPTEA